MRGERVIHISDVRERDAYRDLPEYRHLMDLGGVRTLLIVALRKDRALLGAITAYRQEVRPFTDKQVALLQNFAAQAVIAMENARLITETREALEQQTATAEVLGVINSSPGDLAPVFDAMLEKAARLCEAPFGILRTWDGECFHFGAVHGDPRFCDWVRQRGPIRTDSDASLLGRIQAGERLVHITDAQNDEAYRASAGFREMAEASGIRSAITVTLHKDDTLLGIITVYRQEVRPFSDKQIALLQNFAAQAVIAMENARLLTETREALEQQTATAEVLQVINSSPGDLAPVFEAMLDRAIRLCAATHGRLFTYDGECFHLSVDRRDARYIEWSRQADPVGPYPTTPLGRLIRGERIVHVADIREDEGYRVVPRFRESVELRGVRSQITVALRKDNVLLGAMYVYRQEVRPFSDKQVALLENFAAQAVIAMENARLLTETREALEQQTATAEVLQVINTSPADVAPVFDAILEKAHTLCGAAHGSLTTYDGEYFRAVALRGMPEPLAHLLRQPFLPSAGGSQEGLLHGDRLVHIPDITTRGANTPIQKASIEADIRTLLIVPLRKDGALLGYITANRREVRPFTDKQIALLENFAAQAVIAMENARLLTETREALEQQTATAEVLEVINSSPGDLPPVFDAMVERAVRLCEADAATVRTFDGELLHLAAAHAQPWMMEQLRQLGPSHLNWLYEPLSRGERVIHIPDVRETKAYCEIPGARERLDRRGIRSWLAVALYKDGALLGVLNVNRRDVRPFTDTQIALLENFAAQAVVAMENARLLGELRQRTEEVGELNRDLEARVAEQVDELGRVGRLKRFLAPQLAELIVSQGDEKILESHRREIVVVFCDLRGYTAFTETAEPEEVLNFLREYHGALGPLVSQFEGTLDQFSGDGIMVFFNDPVPCPDPAERAVRMAMAMREAAGTLIADWRERGRDLGFGAGIAQGYATLGQIGFSERSGYTAIGTVCNVAARLCAEAKDGQILLSQLVNVALKASIATEQLGPLALKGLTQPVVAYNVPLAATQPALRVIEGGPPSG